MMFLVNISPPNLIILHLQQLLSSPLDPCLCLSSGTGKRCPPAMSRRVQRKIWRWNAPAGRYYSIHLSSRGEEQTCTGHSRLAGIQRVRHVSLTHLIIKLTIGGILAAFTWADLIRSRFNGWHIWQFVYATVSFSFCFLPFSVQHYAGGWQDWVINEQNKWSREE